MFCESEKSDFDIERYIKEKHKLVNPDLKTNYGDVFSSVNSSNSHEEENKRVKT